jgi:hypothetical protein
VERFIGTLRRECLDHVVVLSNAHLRRLLSASLAYYHEARTHLSLGKDARSPDRWSVPTGAASSRRRWSAASIIGTPAGQHRLRTVAAPAMLTSMATGFPSRPGSPSPPASRVVGLTDHGPGA